MPPPIPAQTGPLDPDTERARRRHERRRARRGLAPDQEQFGLPLPDAEQVKEAAAKVRTAATDVWGGASGGSDADGGTLAGHYWKGYAAADRTSRVGAGVIVLSVLLLLGLGGMTAAAVDEMGYNSIAEIVGVLGGAITFLVSSMFFLFGLNLRASAAARRSALDAGVLAAGFDEETRATFDLPLD
ncbi:MAG: hypothetical protein AAFQ43_02240 [Bacteroidota bacterium]